jgi:hypothetical protein
MEPVHQKELKAFIFAASRATYASGDESIKVRQPDGSTTIEFTEGDFKFHDNYFGGEPYGGREVVFLDGKAVWMMVYYGFVHAKTGNAEVYGFLMGALRNTTADMPYRGPELFEKGSWRYENKLTGELENFSGTEKIFRDGQCIYEASYLGGLVDC